MDFSSWFRKALLKKNNNNKSEHIINNNTSTSTSDSKKVAQHKEDKEEELGVTDQLKDFVKSFTIETFKNFPLQDEQGTTTTTTTLKINDGSSMNSEIVEKDLSDWQERHAMLVLTKVKEISQLRYTLCPRHLKERQFWKIYFMLVKIYVAPYELQAIRQAKLRRMAKQDEKSLDNGFEVEMAEAKRPTSMSSPSLEGKSGSQLDDDGSRELQEDNL